MPGMKEWRVVEFDIGAGIQRSLEFGNVEECHDVGDQVVHSTEGRQIIAMLVASSKMGMTPMDLFNEILVEDHDVLAFLRKYGVENIMEQTTWSKIQAYLLFAKLTSTDVFKPIRGCAVSTSSVPESEIQLVEVKEEPADIEEINFDYEEIPQNFEQESSEEEYDANEERPRLRKRRKDGKAKVSKKMKTPVVKNTPFLMQLVKPVSAIDEAVGFDYADGNEITCRNTEIDEDYDIVEEMNEIQKELEKQQKTILKKQSSERKLRIPKMQILTAAEKKNLMDQIKTSCVKCGNNEPLLHIPQKDYDILYAEHMTQAHHENDVVKCQNEYEAQMILNYRKKCKTKIVNGKTRFICTQCTEHLASFESYTEHME